LTLLFSVEKAKIIIKRFGLTLLLTMIGGILGLSLAIAFVWDWFTSDWVRIEDSPEPIAELMSIERDQVWVKSESGNLYEYSSAEYCQSDCWTIVEKIPEIIPSDDPDHFDVKNEVCSLSKPFFGAEERIEQCHVEMWANRNYVFALRKNGSLYFWQGQVFGEWLVIELFFGLCMGVICLLVPAFLFILVPGIVKIFRKAE